MASSGDIQVEIYLVDGTYELFRHYYALPSARDENGCEVAAVRGVLSSVLGMMKAGATHIAVAHRRVRLVRNVKLNGGPLSSLPWSPRRV